MRLIDANELAVKLCERCQFESCYDCNQMFGGEDLDVYIESFPSVSNEEMIADVLVKFFPDVPCNYNDMDEYCGDWCEEHCGKVSIKECWKHAITERWYEHDKTK